MIRVYGDISGQQSTKVMVAAAYWAPEDVWAAVDRDWSKALADAKVSYFHATDFFSCKGAFSRWKLNGKRHVATARRFTEIPARHELIGYGYGVDATAFEEIVRPVLAGVERRNRLVTPRLFCIRGCLSLIATMLHNCPPDRHERVAVVFEAEHGMGEFVDYFNYCKRRREPWTRWFISFTTAGKDLRPLQAADLLAHEAWRRATDLANASGRTQRKSLTQLDSAGLLDVRLAGENECRRIAVQLRDFLGAQEGD